MTRTIELAVIAGDGIGTEVTEQGLLALDAALSVTSPGSVVLTDVMLADLPPGCPRVRRKPYPHVRVG